MIALAGLGKAFNQGRTNEFWALQGIDLTIAAGTITALRGPSGSGKTTLLTLIGGLARPSVGRITFKGETISALPERFLTELRRQRFGFVFQQFHLIKGLTALQNVMLPAAPTGQPRAEIRARAFGLLEQLRLSHRCAAQVEWLSAGEQQRVAIARALINDPDVLLADEPTANLDSALSLQFLGLLEELNAGGRTILFTSHDPLVVNSSAVHRVVGLRDGRLEP